jgi:Leucine-rich repeat (LRR) protein
MCGVCNRDMPGVSSPEVLESLRSTMPGLEDVPAPFRWQPREPVKKNASDFAPALTLTDASLLGTNAESVLCLALMLPAEPSSKTWQLIQRHSCLQVLCLAGSGLVKLPSDFDLPNLRVLDLSDNALSKELSVFKFCKRLSGLQVVDLRDNPLKEMVALTERLIGTLPCVSVVNGLPVELETRLSVLEAHAKKSAPLLRWEWVVCSVRGIVTSHTWEPQTIRKLLLPNMRLSCFHVKAFVNLELLDLSGNAIALLVDSGIAHCKRLVVCDLRRNAIAKREQLSAFQFNLNLRHLFLLENEVCRSKDYRSLVVWWTRALRGSNWSTGLAELDGEPITLEERVSALQHASSLSSSSSSSGAWKHPDAELTRWYLTLFAHFGRRELASAAGCAKYCVLPNRKLGVADLSALTGLRVLDLSWNALASISGLSALRHLHFLDLSNNPKLSLTSVLLQVLRFFVGMRC